MNKNVITPNSKIKRLALSVVMGMLVLFAGVLAACDNGANNLKLQASVQEVTLYLDENEGDTASLSIFASGANDDVLKDIYIYSSSSSVEVKNQKYVGDGKTNFDVVGVDQERNVSVFVQSKRNLKKMTEIKINVFEPVVSLSKAPSIYKNFIVRGSSIFLDKSLVTFEPAHTFETGLVFTIKDNPAPASIRIEDNVLVVDNQLPQGVKNIQVIASSSHRQISGVVIDFSVIEHLTKDSLSITATTSNINLKEENSVIYLARNSSNIQNEIIKVEVDSDQALKVKPVFVDEFGLIKPNKAGFAELIRESYNQNTKEIIF